MKRYALLSPFGDNRPVQLNIYRMQAYLTRAAYFGKSGRFSRGILNCNEVLRIMSSSLRGYLYRGSLKLHTRAYRSAIEDFTAATPPLRFSIEACTTYHTSRGYTEGRVGRGSVHKVRMRYILMHTSYIRTSYKNGAEYVVIRN